MTTIKETNRILNSLKQITEIGLKLTAVGGLIIGLWQISIQLSTQRKDKVMQLFLQQYEAGVSEIRSNLYRDFDLSKAYEVLQEKDTDTVKKNYKNFMIQFTKNNKDSYQQMLILTNFYNGIASCVESDLCEPKTAKALFETEGRNFFENYHPFFCDIQNRWKDELIEPYSVEFYNLKYKNETNKPWWLFLQQEQTEGFYDRFCSDTNYVL